VHTNRILVVAPHHDDEAIGCGGVIHALAAREKHVKCIWIFSPLEGVDSPAGQKRLEEAATATELLGISSNQSLERTCRSSVTVDQVSWDLVSAIRDFRPSIVLTPHPDDRDREHRLTCAATREAIWLSSSNHRPELGVPAPDVQLVLGYEVWTPINQPQLTIDVSNHIEVKCSAIEAYSSQKEIADFRAAAEGLARYRGALSGVPYAEAFCVISTRSEILRNLI